MAHLWSGRFEGGPDAALFEFGASFRFDRRLFEDDVTGSLAWAEAIHAAGVLSQAEAGAITGALEEILAAGADPAFFDSAAAREDEDVHSFVERELVPRVGDAGRRLHTGRSRNEQVALDLRLYLKRRVPLLQQKIAALVTVLVDQAVGRGRRGDAVLHAPPPGAADPRRAFLPAHTRGAAPRSRAVRRVLLDEIDELPLGSGAIAGTSYAIDVARARRHGSGSRGSSPTASTRPATATSCRRSCTPRRWRWCTSAGWPRTSSCSRRRSSASSSSRTPRRPAAA